MANYKDISVESFDDGQIVRMKLDRPSRRNAQNRGPLVELANAFAEAEADDSVRVVILGGTGQVASLGHDMGSKEQPGTPRLDLSGHPRLNVPYGINTNRIGPADHRPPDEVTLRRVGLLTKQP